MLIVLFQNDNNFTCLYECVSFCEHGTYLKVYWGQHLLLIVGSSLHGVVVKCTCLLSNQEDVGSNPTTIGPLPRGDENKFNQLPTYTDKSAGNADL